MRNACTAYSASWLHTLLATRTLLASAAVVFVLWGTSPLRADGKARHREEEAGLTAAQAEGEELPRWRWVRGLFERSRARCGMHGDGSFGVSRATWWHIRRLSDLGQPFLLRLTRGRGWSTCRLLGKLDARLAPREVCAVGKIKRAMHGQ